MNNIFYVYVHRRADDGQVFYVGKGHGQRAYETRRRNFHWTNTYNKHGRIVEIIKYMMSEKDALQLEIETIALYGRDSLCNYTNGGEGSSGRVVSDECKRKISKSKKGTVLTAEHIEKIRITSTGRKHSDDAKRKIGESNSRRIVSEQTKAKMTNNMPTKKSVINSEGREFQSVGCAVRWLRINGWPKACDVAIIRVCKLRQITAYGYGWSYA